MTGTVSAHGVGVTVDRRPLLTDVSMAATSGEVVAVVGPNGAGKSTLLSVLSGDREPTGGSVTLLGQSVSDLTLDELSRHRAVLAQNLPADIAFRVDELVEMGRHPHRNDPVNSAARDRAAITGALTETELTGWEHRVVSTLSGGERLRAHLARVLAQETPLILLDEPTASLDVAHQEHVLTMCESRAAAGRTVVVVLHDLNAAARYATRIVMLHQGRVVADGPPGEILRSDVLSEVYGQPMVVIDHPYRHCPLVLVVDG